MEESVDCRLHLFVYVNRLLEPRKNINKFDNKLFGGVAQVINTFHCNNLFIFLLAFPYLTYGKNIAVA